MIDKKKKKKKNIKFLNFLKDLSYKYKKEINNILDITIVEDDQLKLLKVKLHKGHKNLKCFLNKTVISSSQFKELYRYLSFADKEKITSKFNSYFSKNKEKYINLKKSNFSKLKFNNFNLKRLTPPTNFRSIQSLKKINQLITFSKFKSFLDEKAHKSYLGKLFTNFEIVKIIEKIKYKKYFSGSLNKKFTVIGDYKKIQFGNKKFLETFQEKISNYKFFSNLFDSQSTISINKPEYIAALYYSDHFLFITKLWKSSENILNVEKVIELPVPASVIGDDVVNNVDELIELSLDSFEVLDLKNPPILIVLSSSFFSIKSFKSDKSNEVSENDEIIQSKSPYLPQDTLIDIQKVNDSIYNAIFTRKSLINGWIKALRKINYPVVGITTPGPHQIDFLRENKKIINEIEIIIDIEFNSTTIFISNRDYELSSQKIPYGSTLYRKKELVESYFSRLIKSIKLLTDDLKMEFPETIYVIGFGLDDFEYESQKLPYPFVRFSELNKTNFKFNKKDSEDLVTTEINSKLNTILGITSKCL